MIKNIFSSDYFQVSKYSSNFFLKTNIFESLFDVFINKSAIEYQAFNSTIQLNSDNELQPQEINNEDTRVSDVSLKNSPNEVIPVIDNDDLVGLSENLRSFDFINNEDSDLEIPEIDKLYIFSDSLADPGNIFNITQAAQIFNGFLGLDITVTPPSPPYFEGRFTNGLVWVEQLANELKLDLKPSTELAKLSPIADINFPLTANLGNSLNIEVSPFFNGETTQESVNFAFGGATTGANGAGEFGDLIPGIQQQVEWFIEDHERANETADSDALYIISGGRNDYVDQLPNPQEVISNIGAEIQSLYDIGARNFLVSNLGDLGGFPTTPPELADSLTNLTQVHNNLLDQTLNFLEDSLTGINIATLNFNRLFNDISENPSDYGLTNITEPYIDPITLTPSVDANPDEYFFFDTVHPTAVVHEIISDFTLATLATEF